MPAEAIDIPADSKPDASAKARRKPQARSRVSNGSATVSQADGRTIWVRRLKDLIEAHEEDLGGSEHLTQAQRSLVRRAATISVELERMEASFAMAGQISADDLDAYQRAASALRRLLESLGIEPRAKLKNVNAAWSEVFQSNMSPRDRQMESDAIGR